MDTYIESLKTQRLQDAHRMREIVDSAKDDKGVVRALTAEEQANLDQLDKNYDRLKTEEDKLVEIAEKLSAGDAVRARIAPAIAQAHDEGAPAKGDGELLATVRAALRSVKNDEKFEERVLNLAIDHGKVLEIAGQMRAIADFSDSAALFMNDFSTKVAVYQRTMSPWISQATVIDADNGRPLVIPKLTADPTTYTPGEATAITENSGTLGEATATPLAYKALSYISNEAEEDEVIGLLNLIAQQQGRSLGFTAGTAMSASILTAATNGGTAGGLGGGSTATFIGYEDFLDLKYGAPAPYRLVGSWVMANGAIKKARKFTDKNGQYLWQPAIAAGQPDTFDGQAVYEDPGLATPASATKSVIYGDMSGWVIKQRGLRVAVSTEFKFDTDQVAIRSVYRVGGALPDVLALRFLVSANA